MTPGQLARRVLGPLFPAVGRVYRAAFVDLDAVVDCLPPLGDAPEILDVGGGDGEPLNHLFRRHPRARVTMLDLSDNVGGAVRAEHAAQVTRLPRTTIRDYAAGSPRPFELVLVTDVVHHVPPGERRAFFEDLRALIGGRHVRLFVKDIEPGSLRALAGLLTDRYVSGDRAVSQISAAAMRELLLQAFPGATVETTDLIRRDPPNYALVVTVNP